MSLINNLNISRLHQREGHQVLSAQPVFRQFDWTTMNTPSR